MTVVGLVAVMVGCVPSGAQDGGVVPAELMARAETQGTVRIIVEYRTGPAGIAAAQDAVLKALEGTAYRVIRRFTAIPHVALEVSPEALRRLAVSPLVVGVKEDRVVSPQGARP